MRKVEKGKSENLSEAASSLSALKLFFPTPVPVWSPQSAAPSL